MNGGFFKKKVTPQEVRCACRSAVHAHNDGVLDGNDACEYVICKRRNRDRVICRQIACYLLRTESKSTLMSIAKELNILHCSVMYAVRTIGEEVKVDKSRKREVEQARREYRTLLTTETN